MQVTGGQVVEALVVDENVVFYTGLLDNSTVSTAVRVGRILLDSRQLTIFRT